MDMTPARSPTWPGALHPGCDLSPGVDAELGHDVHGVRRDPFFTATIGNPTTPNGVAMPYSSSWPVSLFEPTSIGPAVESNSCQFPGCQGDPKAPGRLDEVTFLLERCYQGTSWPWRQPATSISAVGVDIPRLLL